MWISEEEAQFRIGSHRNILNRIRRDSDYDAVSIDPLCPEMPEEEIAQATLDEVGRALRQRKKSGPTLSKKDAADAVIIRRLTTARYAGELYGKNADHMQHIGTHFNQAHGNHQHHGDIVSHVEEQRTKIREAAFDRLNTVLECLDKDKIKKVEKARELAVIGNQLSMISEKMLPKDMQRDENVHFHMFRPEVKKEEDYESVEVGEVREITAPSPSPEKTDA